ncbi:hypothetical protein WA158_002102 [Blastocystis sp. Blastoise]
MLQSGYVFIICSAIIAVSLFYNFGTFNKNIGVTKLVKMDQARMNMFNSQYDSDKYMSMQKAIDEANNDAPTSQKYNGVTLLSKSSSDSDNTFEIYHHPSLKNIIIFYGCDHIISLLEPLESMKDIDVYILCPSEDIEIVNSYIQSGDVTTIHPITVNYLDPMTINEFIINNHINSHSSFNTLFINTQLSNDDLYSILHNYQYILKSIIVNTFGNQSKYLQMRTKIIHHGYKKISINNNSFRTFVKEN